jgi:hypothetical protein
MKETPIWVHLTDGVSEVEYTSEEAQHPFSHYTLKSVGPKDYSETYNSLNRYKLSSVIGDRDLTSTVSRNTNGTLVYSPGEPDCFDEESYSDLVPVFLDKNISWAWLEKAKDVIRSNSASSTITGITLYNPSQDVWKKDKESAVYSEEGTHNLEYYAPTFDDNGNIVTHPVLVWFGGLEKTINWYTGQWGISGTPYDYRTHTNVSNFKLYGMETDSITSHFIADHSGIHKYISGITSSGVDYGYTFRGLGVNSVVCPEDLPYTLSNYTADDSSISIQVGKLNNNFQPKNSASLEVKMKGCYYVEELKIAFKYGYGSLSDEYIRMHGITASSVRFDIPALKVTVLNNGTGDISETANVAYIRSPDLSGRDIPYTDGDSIISYSGADAVRTTRYTVNKMCSRILLSFGALRGDGYAYVDSLEITYRKPEDRVEPVTHFERRVNISRADSGSTDYRDLLYYYNRTVATYGDSLAYTASTDSTESSVKFNNRSVKDVVLEYEYSDPTGTRFAYKDEVKPSSNQLNTYDQYGVLSYQPQIEINTKSRNLIARAHVDDCPQWVTSDSGRLVVNSEPTSGNENSGCGSTAGTGFDLAGNLVLNEDLQECLYDDAKSLMLYNFDTTYEWFWHPDEIAFWGQFGINTSNFSVDLKLSSVVPAIRKLFEHEYYGCTSSLSVPYYDGKVHKINPWQAMGHRIRAGTPLFNDACYAVVVHKIEQHLGESTYGTVAYGDNSSGNKWPYEVVKDAASYISAGKVDKKGTYYGGAIGGIMGTGFGAVDYGGAAQSTTAVEEIHELTVSSRTEGSRADASRAGVHQPE